MKHITFDQTRFEQPKQELYADYIKRTAQLLNRPYIVVFKMVEQWPPIQVVTLYDECVSKWKNRGYKSPSMMWWTERRKLSTPTS